jgi:hypothetical protein
MVGLANKEMEAEGRSTRIGATKSQVTGRDILSYMCNDYSQLRPIWVGILALGSHWILRPNLCIPWPEDSLLLPASFLLCLFPTHRHWIFLHAAPP